jgi:hypothetical protein
MKMNVTRSQNGVVLIICLIMLLLIGIIATTTSQVSLLQLFMAGNEESKSDALQRSLAAVDAIIDNANNLPVVGSLDYVICKTGSSCDAPVIDLAASTPGFPDLDKYPDFKVIRVAPLETTIPVMDESMASSGISYRAARFEVSATYDDTASGQGKSTVTQGVLVKLAAGQ